MWSQLFGEAVPPNVAEYIAGSVQAEMEVLVERPDLPDRLARTGRRMGNLFGAEIFGITPPPRFYTVYDFFDDYLTLAYEVQSHSQLSNWCPQWWRHRSVLFRVSAMWRGYEKLHHVDPLGADEQFLRTIGDHHMRTLLGKQSGMEQCRDAHKPAKTLPSTPMEASNG